MMIETVPGSWSGTRERALTELQTRAHPFISLTTDSVRLLLIVFVTTTLHSLLRFVVTDRVAWSVGRSVRLSHQ